MGFIASAMYVVTSLINPDNILIENPFFFKRRILVAKWRRRCDNYWENAKLLPLS
jgi:hypothetical protein